MYCRNCGAGNLDDNASGCAECGLHPLTYKKYCQSCGGHTLPEQVVCTACKAPLKSKSALPNLSQFSDVDFQALKKNPAFISAAVALLFCFFPWIKMNAFGAVNTGFSVFSLSHPLTLNDTILSPALLYLFPLSLLGMIASEVMTKVDKVKREQIKRICGFASLALVVYTGFGFYQLTHPSGASSMMLEIMDSAYSIGFGFYLSALATLATAFFYGFYRKKPAETSTFQQTGAGQ